MVDCVTDTNFIRVDEWEPEEEDKIIKCDGKLIIIPFDKIFKKESTSTLNVFIIKKESYVNQLNNTNKKNENGIIINEKGIIHYLNYFIKFYDINNELLMSYFKLKYFIDNKSSPIKKPKTFIKFLYGVLFTETMKEKITKMVEDNYYIDLTSSDKKKYSESLEITNEHAKIMMMISMSIKIMIPVVFQYINVNNVKKEVDYIYNFYKGLFDLYGKGINIYNKLMVTVSAKINKNLSSNKPMWEQQEIFGVDPLIYLNSLLKKNIITETMFKYVFNKNIVNFNSFILEKQLYFVIKKNYKVNLVELSADKSGEDGLSGLDKFEMNSNKIDESLIILSEVNIKRTIKNIKKNIGVDVTKDEITFYKKFHKVNKFQVQLVHYFYAKHFGGYRDLNLLTRKQYITLVILLKRRLQIQGGLYLPQIISGNIEGRLNTRTIQNTKFLNKLEETPLYQSLIQDKYSTLQEVKRSNLILNLLSTILNSTFTIVDYDHLDKLGEKLEINQDIVSDEFLSFLNQL